MAGLVAATLLGRDVHSYRIGYAIGVNVEGPSAGALTTAALLALMHGQPALNDVAMTEALGHITLAGATADIAVATGGWLGRGGPALAAGSEGNTALRSAEKLHELAAAANLQYFDVLIASDLASTTRCGRGWTRCGASSGSATKARSRA